MGVSLSSTTIAPPEGVREGNGQLVHLTADAGGKITALIAREQQGGFPPIAIHGGGCNGLSYKLRFGDRAAQG